MASFLWNKYHDETSDNPGNYNDGSDNYANAGFTIGFHHVISSIDIYFKAFMTAYNETFNADWVSEQVYGRVDPIYTFKQTTRRITIGFKVPASSMGEAYENLAKVQQLSQFMYPAYTDVNNANTIAQGSLVRVKFMNLLQSNPYASPSDTSAQEMFADYAGFTGASNGLLGIIGNLTINHNLDGEVGVLEASSGDNSGATILPKMIDVNFDFSPIHETPLGWKETVYDKKGNAYTGEITDANRNQYTFTTTFASPAYPYGAALASEQASVSDGASSPESDNPATNASADAAAQNALP